ncbi:hypothetical protein P170DRAFT_12103 [Aspergillus steynii IBT 23096]|uniref:DUF7707 domain-containing protein n=1 Tax=Aspergillus steynii IBT 23096 TaxID=1392250 RepID=A0A2I2GN19_9EURO|nr:uncharacterized protein P170DRAFT_12103 [Aspergillus steynii IBT 23096]PLB54275.1 hypothetical protein P170DRAFT_12103 [Aspergillus steynii IBT 23096]
MLPILLLSTLVASATAANNYTLPEGFDLNKVNPSTRASWCVAERNACPKICGGVSNANSCDPSTLDFTCTCGNGSAANVEPYQGTVPYFVCQENFGQCIERSSSLDEEEKCKDARSGCGSQNASESSSSSSTTTSATSLPTATESSDSSDDDEESSTATRTSSSTGSAATTTNAAVRMAQDHATGVLATVFFLALRLTL